MECNRNTPNPCMFGLWEEARVSVQSTVLVSLTDDSSLA